MGFHNVPDLILGELTNNYTLTHLLQTEPNRAMEGTQRRFF